MLNRGSSRSSTARAPAPYWRPKRGLQEKVQRKAIGSGRLTPLAALIWPLGRVARRSVSVAFVGGVPQEMDSDMVQNHLQQYGSCSIIKRCRGYVYVRFRDPEALAAALRDVHVVSGQDLTVEVAKAKKKQWYCDIDPGYPPRVRRLMEGVVHIQNMLSMAMQVDITKQILSLGSASAGFYTPQFQDRAMKLQMFCLGRHWDTQSHSYSDVRADHDHLQVLSMPSNLKNLAKGILSDLQQKCGQALFPMMEPDTCIVNYYDTTGSLGLHQDLDESETSIAAGIPVISISLGCSARFLYQPNTEPLDNAPISSTLLRSGDIFVFGSKARGLKHGVQKIFPKTAPKKWQEIAAHGGTGRLNLTFRQTQ